MFYLKIRCNLYHNAYLLAGSEPPSPPGRNEASLERMQVRRGKRKRKERKRIKDLHKTLEQAEDYSEITHMGSREA